MIKERKIMSDMKLLYRIDDNKDYTNMGGIAIDENGTLYCVKSSRDNKKQCLYVIKNYKSAKKEKGFVTPSRTHNYERLGHANSLTLSGDNLYVATDENYIVKLPTSELLKKEHESGTKINIEQLDINISSIATAVGDNSFIVHFSGQNDRKTRYRIYFSSIISESIEYKAENIKVFGYPDELAIDVNNTEAQDIFYKDGYLYFILTEKKEEEEGKVLEFKSSYILKYHYESCTFVGYDVFTNKNAKKFEIESMHIDSNNNLTFSANENKKIVDKKDAKKKTIVNDWDAIYIVKNWELASKEITAINTNN